MIGDYPARKHIAVMLPSGGAIAAQPVEHCHTVTFSADIIFLFAGIHFDAKRIRQGVCTDGTEPVKLAGHFGNFNY